MMLTLREIEKELKVERKTLLRWIHAGKLKAYMVGSRWRVYEQDLEEFIKKGENKDNSNGTER